MPAVGERRPTRLRFRRPECCLVASLAGGSRNRKRPTGGPAEIPSLGGRRDPWDRSSPLVVQRPDTRAAPSTTLMSHVCVFQWNCVADMLSGRPARENTARLVALPLATIVFVSGR